MLNFFKKKKLEKERRELLETGMILALMNIDMAQRAKTEEEKDIRIQTAKNYLMTVFDKTSAKKSASK